MTESHVDSERELIEGFRQSRKYKEFRSNHLQHKIDREKAAWQMLNENRGQYTTQILNHIFDTIDHHPQNKRLWFGSLLAAPNRNLIFGSDISLINQWIDQLLFSGKEAESLLNTCLRKYKIKGASKGLATLLLYLSNPDRYNIWVNSTQDGLSVLGYISDLKGQEWGKNYTIFNNAAIDFRKKNELLPQELDWVLTHIVSYLKKEDKHCAASSQASTFQTDLQTDPVREIATEKNQKMNDKDELEFETPLEEEVDVIEVPPGSEKKYKKFCLAETFVQVGEEESIRERLVDNPLEFHNIDTFQDLTEAVKAHKDQPPKAPENDIPMEIQGIERERRTTTELTSTAKKIMEVFRYFRVKKGEYLSVKLIRSKQHLWKDIEEEEFNQGVGDLIELGYIGRIENPEGWRLLEAGDEYLKQRILPV